MKEKIKIIHFITHLPVGGAQDNTLFTLELLDKKKYEIRALNNHMLVSNGLLGQKNNIIVAKKELDITNKILDLLNEQIKEIKF